MQQDWAIWSPHVRVRERGENGRRRGSVQHHEHTASNWEALLSTLVFILLALATQICATVASSTGLKSKANHAPPAHASYEDMIVVSYLATRTVT